MQQNVLIWLRAGVTIATDRVTPIQSFFPKPIPRPTMNRLEQLGYVRQDHDHFTVNGSEVWRYVITIAGLEALREG